MKQRDGFKRVTIDEMKAKRRQQEFQNAVNEAISNLNETIEEEAEKLAQELVDSGYDVDDFEIDVDVEVSEGKLIVHFKVVQEAKQLVLDVK